MADNFGAIAYDSGRQKFGQSHNYSNAREARAVAMQYCGSADCKIVNEFFNDCAALAIGPGSTAGWADYMDERRAMRAALAACNGQGAPCHPLLIVCNDRPQNASARPQSDPHKDNRPVHGCWNYKWERVPYCKD